MGNTPHRLLRCPLHEEDRAGLSDSWLADAEGLLRNEMMEGRVHRLLPVRRHALLEPPREADTAIQEVRWEAGHGTGYHAFSEWDDEGAVAMERVTLDGEVVAYVGEFSAEVQEECRQWKVRSRLAGTLPEEPFEGWVCSDGSVVDGNGHILGRAGAAIVQLGGSAGKATVMGWEKEPSINPLQVRALCCSMGGVD